MMIAGALTAMNRINGVATFALSVGASLIADLLWFWAGRRYGYPVLRFLCKVSLSPDTCVRQTEGIFQKWGFFSVVVSKFVPGFSTVGPPIAGALKMPVGAFTVASTASAALWVGAAMGVGLIFSREIEVALTWMSNNAPLAATVVGAAFALYIAYKGWQRWRLSRYVDSALDHDRRTARAPRAGAAAVPGSTSARASRTSNGRTSPAQRARPRPGRQRDDFPLDREIVVYCNCPNEAPAKRAAQILLKRDSSACGRSRAGSTPGSRPVSAVEHGIPIRIGKAARAAGD